MNIKLIDKASKAMTFDELIAAAFVVATTEQHALLSLSHERIWKDFREQLLSESLSKNKIEWIVTPRKWAGER